MRSVLFPVLQLRKLRRRRDLVICPRSLYQLGSNSETETTQWFKHEKFRIKNYHTVLGQQLYKDWKKTQSVFQGRRAPKEG